VPPRFAYWTILIDDKPTAFRARDKEELLPTLHQLQRKSPNAVMRWFARGRLWDNPEQAQWALRNAAAVREKRSRDWRPGGQHADPRARPPRPTFKRSRTPQTGPPREKPQGPRPWQSKPAKPRPWEGRPAKPRPKRPLASGDRRKKRTPPGGDD
jgi:hypothetical protein